MQVQKGRGNLIILIQATPRGSDLMKLGDPCRCDNATTVLYIELGSFTDGVSLNMQNFCCQNLKRFWFESILVVVSVVLPLHCPYAKDLFMLA